MKTQQKIEKKGYKVIYNMGWRNGVQTITSVSATKGMKKILAKNITELLKAI